MSRVAFHPKASSIVDNSLLRSADEGRGASHSLNQRVYAASMAPFRALYALYDFVCPENPLTKQRQLRIFPESLEIAFGRYGYGNSIDANGGPWRPYRWEPAGYNGMVSNYKKMTDESMKKMIPFTGRPKLPWKMTMVNNQVVNAWAKMGGFMGIHRGLIERMEAEKRDFGLGHIPIKHKIAAVVGHEMAHPAARHTARLVEISLFWTLIAVVFEPAFMLLAGYDLLEGFFFSSYSRSQEFEADRYGMEMMWKAGYDPKAAVWAQHFLKDYEDTYGIRFFDVIDRLFWSHPSSDERIKANKITLAELSRRKRPAHTHSVF